MRILGNILWHFPFFGFLTAFGTFLMGGILFISVIGAPIGLGLIELSKFLLAPFSKAMIDKKDLNMEQNKYWQAFGLVIRILYFPFGLLLAIVTIFQIAGLFITLVGIPLAIVLAKSLGTFFNPVNKKCVPRAVQDELESRAARAEVEKYLNSKSKNV
ncbi:YccF domain-containing protein [Caldithrix abyssi]